MDLKLIENFCVIAEELSFSRAARRLRISQPALSLQMKKLEEELGTMLLDRMSSGVCLTAAGEKLVQRAPRLLGCLRDVRQEVADAQGTFSGELTVGVIPTIAPFLLPSVLKWLQKQAPQMRLKLKEAVTVELVADLKAGNIDLALLSSVEDTATINVEQIAEEALHLIAPANHSLVREKKPVRIGDLANQPFLAMHEVHCLARQVSHFCSTSRGAPSIVLRTNQLETIRAFVRAGMGVSIVPAMMCTPSDKLSGCRCIAIAPKPPTRPINLAWSILRYRGAGSRLFRNAVQEALGSCGC